MAEAMVGEDILQPIFENNPIALIIINADGAVVRFNRKADEWSLLHFGMHFENSIDIRLRIAKDDVHDFDSAWKLISDGKNQVMVWIMHDLSGIEYWYEIVLSRIISSDYDSPVLISVSDITSNRKAIDYLAESENRLKSLLYNSSGIIMVVDETRRIIFATENSRTFLGYEVIDLRGKDLRTFIHESNRDRFDNMMNNAAKKDGEVYSAELQLVKKDGSVAFFEANVKNHYDNPAIKGIIVNMHDITERRYLDELMMRISNQNELILDTAKEGIFGINARGLISFINPCAASMLDFKVEELTGVDFKNLIRSSGVYEADHPLVAAVSGALTVNSAETYFCSKSGMQVLVEFSFSPIDFEGRRSGAVVTFKDIRTRKEFEDQLTKAKDEAERANNAKGEFLAVMSHEIRTPMNGILGFLEILSMSGLSAEQNNYVSIAYENAKHLLGIINDILDFSRIDKGKLELESILFDPKTEFAPLLSMLSVKAREKNQVLDVKLDENLPVIAGDPMRIKQVLTNLIGNAIKFTPKGGSVRVEIRIIECTEEKALLYFAVIDSGIGIAPERQKIIFESFTQSDSSVSRRFGGSGLGLTISAGLVSLMGGSIELASEAGKGSSFSFALSFPRGAGFDTAAAEQERIAQFSAGRDLLVLVAEDTEHVRRLIELMLAKLGVRAEYAVNGREAYEKFQQKKYDLVFMDGSMPEMSGIDAVRHIRQYEAIRNLSHTPIVALSARAITGDRDEFFEAGVDDYLAKPVTFSALASMIGKRVLSEGDIKAGNAVEEIDSLAASLGIPREMVASLLTDFVGSLPDYVKRIDDAFKDGDWAALRSAAHKLKGAALTYHMQELGNAAGWVEDNASADASLLREQIDFIISEAENVGRRFA